MIRVFTDFNAITPDDVCWNLVFRGVDLDRQIDDLGLKKGDRILLYQDEDDFDVEATLDHRYVDMLAREAWVAIPDWSTLVRKGMQP